VTIEGNLDGLYANNPNVFVAGDLLWYPVEGHPEIRTAPDTMVVFGRPKGYRGSYQQWRENGLAPQVTFEVLSPCNRAAELQRKFEFYDRYGVEEYYLYDPDGVELSGWIRTAGTLQPIAKLDGWISPRLGIRFDLSGGELVIYRPDGKPFLTFVELMQQRQEVEERAVSAERKVQSAEHRAQSAENRAQSAEERAEQLARRLRALGIDPDAGN
jgi:Uma2 family endonuclease